MDNDKQQLQDLKRSIDMPALLTGYGVDLKKQGASYVALCIWHDEKRPSMGVFQGDDGIWRCNCHSCGQRGTAIDVVMEMDGVDTPEAIQRLKRNHFVRDEKRIKAEAPIVAAKWKHQKPPEPLTDFTLPGLTYVAHWEYRDLDNSLLGYVARYFDKDGNKEYRPWTFGTMAQAIKPAWKCRAFSNPRPLYGLHKLTSGANDKRIVMTEGEKTADAAQKLLPGMISIGWPGGANAIAHIDWQQLAGRNVLLVPDADPAGEKAMYDAARYLLAIGCTVRLLDTSDKIYVKKGWDLADALEEGWTTDDIKTFCEDRITTLTSREIEAEAARRIERESEEKKTVEIAAELPDDMPPSATLIEGELVRVDEISDTPPPNVIPIKPHTSVSEMLPQIDAFSDVRMAETWADGDGKDWLYCHSWEKWLEWDGSRWKIDQTRSAFRQVADEMKRANGWLEANQLSIKDRRALCGIGKITAVLNHARTLRPIARTSDDFDTNMMLLGTPEGTIDLTTGELREPRREDMITKQTLVAPKRGNHPTWDKVIQRATKGDPETKAYFQRWWGYMLTGSCREESMLMCVGAGASGKTKYLLVADILGEYMVDMDIGLLMESKTERHSSELASLEGARIIRTTEPEEGSRFNESILKRLTGREKISARRLYSECHTFTMQGKIIMGSNFRPSLKSTGEEIRRRIHFVDFPESIPEAERDYDLDKKLQAEYPAILQWMVDGCLEWQRIGLAKPESVRKATGAYLDEEDTLAHWIEEKCTTGKTCKMLSGDAYRSYAEYIEAHGEGVVSQKRFSQRMESRGFGKQKGSGGTRWITGIELAPEPVPGSIPGSWTASFDDNGF